jgi:sigma-B regulation protein RsbQ
MPDVAEILRRHHISRSGKGHQPMLFAHGFGCDQQMWRFVAPAFADSHEVLLFDHVGCGHADSAAYDDARHARIEGYAEDVCTIIDTLDLHDLVYVGHSVSAMIGVLAALHRPERFARLVMVGPSPCYLNHPPDYCGGFEPQDIEGLLELMETNLLGWANFLAPTVMGVGNPTELTEELKSSFCAADAHITRRFARATFLADHRHLLGQLQIPALVIQVAEDAIAPRHVGEYVHAQLPHSELRIIDGIGHCPHMSQPESTIHAIRAWLETA